MASRPPENQVPESTVKARFFAIHAVRLSGVALVVIGLLAINGKFAIAPAAGYALLAFGLLDVIVIPQVLARKWRSPHP